jgi:hypothetical protein
MLYWASKACKRSAVRCKLNPSIYNSERMADYKRGLRSIETSVVIVTCGFTVWLLS